MSSVKTRSGQLKAEDKSKSGVFLVSQKADLIERDRRKLWEPFENLRVWTQAKVISSGFHKTGILIGCPVFLIGRLPVAAGFELTAHKHVVFGLIIARLAGLRIHEADQLGI